MLCLDDAPRGAIAGRSAHARATLGAISAAKGRGRRRGCPGSAGANRAAVGSCRGEGLDEGRPAVANLDEVGISFGFTRNAASTVASAIENRVWPAERVGLRT